MRNRNLLKDQGGFTLIEIIAVLVILGILAAVAVPKFFDLQTKAREKAIYTAMSEVKVRVNQHFAKKLLEGDTWTAIWANATTEIGTDLGSDFSGITYTLSGTPPSPTTGSMTVTGSYIVGGSGGNVIPINEVIDLPRYTN
jgi:prepilin-type N-terminal cleavage/methylation domain-containing protein